MKKFYDRNIQDIQTIESHEIQQESVDLLDKQNKNLNILIPFKNQKYIPDYLIDFIQNDPNFYPNIATNNLEDTYIEIHD